MTGKEKGTRSGERSSQILIVEDEGIIAMRLEQLLTHLDYEVVGMASRGEDAISAVAEKQPDLILMDIKLAGELDGVETAARIRERFNTPIVYLSAHPERMITEEVQRTQPAGFLSKPVRNQELLATVEMALYKHRMETKLRESEAKLRALTNATEQSFVLLDRAGVVLACNRVAQINTQAVFGVTIQPGDAIERFVLDRDRAEFAVDFARALTGETIQVEKPFPLADGTTRWFAFTYHPVREDGQDGEDGQVTSVGFNTIDITDRKRTETVLQESEARFRSLFAASPDAILLAEAETGVISYANAAAAALFEHPIDRLVGMPYHALHPTSQSERARAAFTYRPPDPDDNAPPVGIDIVTAQDETKTVEIRGRDIQIGGKAYVLGNFRDITERKQMEEALRKSEEHFRLIAETSSDVIFQLDLEGQITYCSPSVQRVFGLFADEVMGNHLLRFFPEAGKSEAMQNVEQVIATQEARRVEAEIVGRDGTLILVETNLAPVVKNGTVIGIQGQVRNITERRRMEEALQKSEERFRKSFDTEVVAIAISRRRDGMFIEANPGFLKVTGYDYNEIVGHTSQELEFLSPSQRQTLITSLEEKGRLPNQELTFPTRSGELRTILFSIDPITIDNEDCMLATMVDITERKRMEDALRESERALARAQAIAHVGSYSWDLVEDISSWSEELHRITGCVGREPSFALMVSLLHPDDRDRVLKLGQRAREDGILFDIEYRIIKPDGAVRWVRDRAEQVTKDAGGASQHIIGTVQDITERKQAEETLRESEEKFRTLFNSAGDAIFIHDLEGNFLEINREAVRRLGYSREELLQMRPSDIDAADYALLVPKRIEQIRENGHVIFETAHITKDDKTIPIELSSRMIRYGEEQAILSVARDITERKQAEHILSESEKRFRTIVNALPQFVAYTDKNLVYCFVNQTYQKKFGIKPEEVLGKSLPEVIGEEAFEEARPHVEKALQGEQVRYHERYDYAIGGTRDVDGILVPDIAADGEVRGYYAVLTDITPYMEMQEELRRFTERLRLQHEIDAAILSAQSPEAIASAALERLYHLVPCQFASIAEIDSAQQRYRDMILLIDAQAQAQASDWRPISDIGSRLFQDIRQGEISLIADITALPKSSPLEQRLAKKGVQSYISVPLMVQDALLGALNLACDTPDFFRPEHIEILEEIGASLAVAMQQAALLEQTQRDAETKGMLLHEVNHRVMNNLTMILSLLQLEIEQPRTVENQADLQAVLQDFHSRISGIATVHRMLIDLGGEQKPGAPQDLLDLAEVVTEVIHAALSASPVQQWVDVVVDAAENLPRLSAKQATTLALIVNELITNSVKYAFTDRAQGRIQVQIDALSVDKQDAQGAPQKVRLIFRDDGPGLPDDVLAGERRGVGLWLAQANTTRDLEGEIAWRNDEGPDGALGGGAVVEIQFPVR